MNPTKAKHQLFRRGVIAPWYLFSYQMPLYNLLVNTSRDLIVPNTSRRYGKSTVCVTYAIEQCLRNKRHVRYATAFLTDLEAYIEPIFDSILSDCPEDIRPTWSASKKVWKFKNGSSIKLVGLDKNPNGIRGNAIDDLIIDEAAFVDKLEYLYKSIIIPATMKRQFKLIFPSTPPVSPEHFWARELLPKAKIRNTYLEQDIDTISDMPPEERKRLLDEVGGEHCSTAQREFFCKIVVDENRAIAPSFNVSRHIVECEDAHISWQYVGDSGGIRDKTAILKVGFSHDRQKIIIKSELIFDSKTPTPVLAKDFQTWSGTDSLIFDAHGQTRVDLASLGLKATMPAKDDFGAGLQLLNAAFHNDNVQIDPSCSLLITTLTSGLLTSNRKDYERSESLGHCDAVAALIYAVRAVDKVTDLRPKPKASETFILPVKSNNHNLIKAFG